ncbi:MAG: class I SAM-dependent methyltransferase [Candidatus Tectimicrobiota bacterium]
MSVEESTYSEMDRAYFNRYAEGYSPYTPEDLEVLLADLVALVRERATGWICEIGSADGQFSSALMDYLPERRALLGVDIAERVLQRYPFHKLCGSAFQMPVISGALDVVCFAASLHHLEPFAASLSELSRVLAPGGIVYFLEPNFLHPQRRFFMTQRGLYHRYRQANDVPVNPLELCTALQALGIDVLSLRYINLHFRAPGLLQTVQNTLARVPWPTWLRPYVMPWFVLIGVKRETTQALPRGADAA